MRKKLCILWILVTVPAFAAPDGVEVMKTEYLGAFKELPPARKCKSTDAKGAWKSVMEYKRPAQVQTPETIKHGPQYLMFADYNRLVSVRTTETIDATRLQSQISHAPLQYIATDAGMLYIYRGGKLYSSNLCFVSETGSKRYPAGYLMLAVPVEKDKPLSITLYEPLK